MELRFWGPRLGEGTRPSESHETRVEGSLQPLLWACVDRTQRSASTVVSLKPQGSAPPRFPSTRHSPEVGGRPLLPAARVRTLPLLASPRVLGLVLGFSRFRVRF